MLVTLYIPVSEAADNRLGLHWPNADVMLNHCPIWFDYYSFAGRN